MYQKLKGLYAITDEILTPDESVFSQVEEALKAGITLIQYRNKTKTDDEVEALCRDLQTLCRQHNALFIIDDRPYLAEKINADGLHIGKDDMPLAEAKKIFTQGIIGVSCYGSIAKAKEAQDEGADYVAFGSFFSLTNQT
jgi:thiamine-phosphate pyrophosphorylase